MYIYVMDVMYICIYMFIYNVYIIYIYNNIIYVYLIYIYIYMHINQQIPCLEKHWFCQILYSVYVTIETDISLVSEIPVEELQTKGENVKIKENEKTATENNGNHEISLI